MDKNIRPQDDFYRHVNGKWLDEFVIPADKSNDSRLVILTISGGMEPVSPLFDKSNSVVYSIE
jgi:predicted metalloendopeptidase